MVDVTFLLLVFFIVTASFTLQNSLAQQPVDQGPTPIQTELADAIQVQIDEQNQFELSINQEEAVPVGSLNELKRQLKNFELNQSNLVINAHSNSTHQVVVSVWDLALRLGIEKIQIKSTDHTF